ncbi:dienelactone hydrolase family protein [Desulfovibrio gilichinskyi]|uniref:Dienelactone hydrolase n=1 Tax=Desulfovibrio gilichinskyi TaxID=1519643 RepID=A0A1X7DYZ0_9BACT|nr:dienelactone hydrolase family protein [Desulfovibrio gilichinskyi]SMF24047.1 Dienelactone hydrolase [Desulfovibrio gilichinskyi]
MLKEKIIIHTHQEDQLESVLVIPDGSGPFPAVLLIHEYTGLNKVTLDHARRLATAGYVVLAADFYGPAKRPKNINEARTVHRIFRDNRVLMRSRAKSCLETLINQPETDSAKLAALGFSFGGGAVLEIARICDLKQVISVYGYLDTTHPASFGQIKAKIFAVHVEDDPVVPESHAEMFTKEMNDAEADWSIKYLKNTKHGFMSPDDKAFDQVLAEKTWDIILENLNK